MKYAILLFAKHIPKIGGRGLFHANVSETFKWCIPNSYLAFIRDRLCC